MHLAWRAPHVHRHDRLGALRDLELGVHRVQSQGLIDFRQHRHRPDRHHGPCRSDPCIGWYDDFIPRPHAQSGQPANERRGTGAHRYRMAGSQVPRECPLKFIDLGTAGIRAVVSEKPLTAQNVRYGLLLLGTQAHSAGIHGRQRMFNRRRSAVDGKFRLDQKIRFLRQESSVLSFSCDSAV